jgi:hypothetical protein
MLTRSISSVQSGRFSGDSRHDVHSEGSGNGNPFGDGAKRHCNCYRIARFLFSVCRAVRSNLPWQTITFVCSVLDVSSLSTASRSRRKDSVAVTGLTYMTQYRLDAPSGAFKVHSSPTVLPPSYASLPARDTLEDLRIRLHRRWLYGTLPLTRLEIYPRNIETGHVSITPRSRRLAGCIMCRSPRIHSFTSPACFQSVHFRKNRDLMTQSPTKMKIWSGAQCITAYLGIPPASSEWRRICGYFLWL